MTAVARAARHPSAGARGHGDRRQPPQGGQLRRLPLPGRALGALGRATARCCARSTSSSGARFLVTYHEGTTRSVDDRARGAAAPPGAAGAGARPAPALPARRAGGPLPADHGPGQRRDRRAGGDAVRGPGRRRCTSASCGSSAACRRCGASWARSATRCWRSRATSSADSARDAALPARRLRPAGAGERPARLVPRRDRRAARAARLAGLEPAERGHQAAHGDRDHRAAAHGRDQLLRDERGSDGSSPSSTGCTRTRSSSCWLLLLVATGATWWFLRRRRWTVAARAPGAARTRARAARRDGRAAMPTAPVRPAWSRGGGRTLLTRTRGNRPGRRFVRRAAPFPRGLPLSLRLTSLVKSARSSARQVRVQRTRPRFGSESSLPRRSFCPAATEVCAGAGRCQAPKRRRGGRRPTASRPGPGVSGRASSRPARASSPPAGAPSRRWPACSPGPAPRARRRRSRPRPWPGALYANHAQTSYASGGTSISNVTGVQSFVRPKLCPGSLWTIPRLEAVAVELACRPSRPQAVGLHPGREAHALAGEARGPNTWQTPARAWT